MSHCGLAIIYIKKRYVMAKQENYENSSISPSKNIINLPKKENPLKENQNPSRYNYNSIITNLSQVSTPSQKISSSFKNPHIIKIDLLLLLLFIT
jgi:hypothetical protein